MTNSYFKDIFDLRIKLFSNKIINILLLFIFFFSLLIPFWTINGVFWDGWIYEYALSQKKYNDVIVPFFQNGRLFTAYLIILFDYFDNPSHAALITSCILISISGCLFYYTIKKLNILPNYLILISCVIGVVWPGYEVHLSLSSISNSFSLFFFYCGFYFLSSFTHNPKKFSYNTKILISIFFILSFIGEVTFVLMPFVFLFLTQTIDNSQHLLFSKKTIFIERFSNIIKVNKYLILVTVLSFIIFLFFFSPSGEYENLRFKSFENANITLIILKFIQFFLIYEMLFFPFFLLLLIILVLKSSYVFLKFKTKLFFIILISFFGIILSFIPFIIGNRVPNFEGWGLRMLYFCGFQYGLFIISILYFFYKNLNLKKIILSMLLIIIVLPKFYIFYNHIYNWKLRSIVDKSLINYMNENKIYTDILIYFDEYASIYKINNEYYRDYEFTTMTKIGTNNKNSLATNYEKYKDKNNFIKNFVKLYLFPEFKNKSIKNKKCLILNYNSEKIYNRNLLKKIIFTWYYSTKTAFTYNLLNIKIKKCRELKFDRLSNIKND